MLLLCVYNIYGHRPQCSYFVLPVTESLTFLGFNFYVISCFWPGQIKSREADHRFANRRIRDCGPKKNDA